MPELPEVETIKEQLRQAVVGKTIVRVSIENPKVIRQPDASRFKKELQGARVTAVLRKAKVLILELSNGKALTIHLKMTGQLIYPGRGNKSRVMFHLSDGTQLDYNDQRLFGEMRLLDDWHALPFIRGLGPEPFEITVADFSRMLAGKKTKIKPLLLDQVFVSGIGNLYAAEALFKAKIHPARQAASLNEKEKAKLFTALRETLNEAIKYRGSSVDQYVQLSGKKGEYVKFHKVYGREDKPCLVCKTSIKRISLGGRGTYFCPRCQA